MIWIIGLLFDGAVSDLLFAVTQQSSGSFEPPLALRSLRFMRPLRSPRLPLAAYWGPVGEPAVHSRVAPGSVEMPERSRRISKTKRFWRCPSKGSQSAKKQHDVCHRERDLRVPTSTAAQLGLHVFARQSGGWLWCVRSRHLCPGHERLQAQRSWSELQLSQQVLPPEEWGTVPRYLTHTCQIICKERRRIHLFFSPETFTNFWLMLPVR